MKSKILLFFFITVLVYSFISCTKTTIQFGSAGTESDPNITLIDTFTADLSTLQVDSFLTNNGSHFIVGTHIDPQLGYIAAKSYFQITAPSLDLRDCNNCVFDSIELKLKVSSGYLGDTIMPFTINVHEILQEVDESENVIGYNVSTLAYEPIPLASKTFFIRPSLKNEISIKLPEQFGRNLFRMFRANSDTITNNTRFKKYLKGLCLETSSSNNALFYFEKADTDSIIKLYYTQAAATPIKKKACFTISSTDYQFNSFTYDKSATGLSVFTPKRKQLVSNALTSDIVYMHNNSGLYPKIKFNNLYRIKELYPYVEVLRAELEIKPVNGSYGVNTIYQLPSAATVRLTDDDNGVSGTPLYFVYGTEIYNQTGNLYIDNLYGESTAYTYDVTNFVNTVISEGAFSKTALLMSPYSPYDNDNRLLIGNGHSGGSVKLKLYILGL